jgi:hypothetical protein
VFLLSLGFLLIAMCSAGALLWALVDWRSATRLLGSKFAIVGAGEAIITLYALGRGITFLTRPEEKPNDNKPTYIGSRIFASNTALRNSSTMHPPYNVSA